jgi:FlgD Ig-like domain
MKETAAGLRVDRLARFSPRRLRLVSPAALVFAALVVATVGAFFVTTRLKRSKPVLEQLTFNRHFSPNGDGRLDFAVFAFRLRRADDVTVSIVKRDGDQVRTLAEDRRLSKGRRHRFRWDGRTSAGVVAPDGEYHIRIGLRHQGRTVTSPRKLFLDTTPPRPVVRYVSPDVITPGAGGRRSKASLRYTGPTRRPTLLVYRTDLGNPRLVARRAGRTGSSTLRWDGRTGLDRPGRAAPAGSYLMAVQVRDVAGNIGPAKLPPTRDTVKGHPGVEVRYLAAVSPGSATQGGGAARFSVLAAGRRYRWSVRRRGSSKSLRKGSSTAAALRIRVPRSLAGLALLDLRVGPHRYTVPFAVQPRKHRRVLVVLPTFTWQALNPVEQDGDGFPDLLPLDPAVGLRRPLSGDGLPRGFGETASVLGYLDGARLRYDLETDETFLHAGTAALRRYSGVLFAGPERFAPATVTRLLRSYAGNGGGVAWAGTGGFAREVTLGGSKLSGGRPAGSAAALGERVRLEGGSHSIVVLGDTIDFFSGVSGDLGPYNALEPSLRLPARTRLLASAGAEPRRPAVVVYRTGRGFVARLGVSGFGHSLATSADAGRIMRRLWTLLSR